MTEISAAGPQMPIENVGTEVGKRVRRRWREVVLWTIAAILAVIFLGLTFQFWRIEMLALILAPWMVIAGIENARVMKEFMSQFAAANGYAFQEAAGQEEIDKMHGALYQVGRNEAMKNIISGSYLGHPLRIFNFYFMVGSGKSSRTVPNTVLELKLDTNLPNIFLLGPRYWSEFAIRSSKENLKFSTHPKKVPLGGEFGDAFKLYAPEDYEVEALQIFDHGVLQKLHDSSRVVGGFAIELAEDTLYIYLKKEVREGKKLRGAYEMAKLVAENLGPLVQRMKPMLTAQEEVFTRLNQT